MPLPPLRLLQRRLHQLHGCRWLFLLPFLLPLLLLVMEQAIQLRQSGAVCLMLRRPVLHLAVPGAVVN
jgi:hypothetical protein